MSVDDAFRAAFGRLPAATASAPGRVNLIGEHIDYNGGTVLPAALEHRITVALAPNGGDTVRIRSAKFGGDIERGADEPASGDWSDYTLGALALARREGWVPVGMDVAMESGIPDGAGVSSSAALITAVFRAATAMARVEVDAPRLANLARDVENEYIGMPCGIMDQMAVGLAEPGEALVLDTATQAFETIEIPDGWSFVTVHSGVHRKLSDGRYKARFEECEAARATLGADHLCLLSADQRAAADRLDAPLSARVRHVTTEHERVLAAVVAMKSGDAARFGDLMNESHRSYAEDFEASTPEIDALAADARELGALGARLTGGGFGGCIVCLLRTGDVAPWLETLVDRHPNAWRV